MTTQKRLHIVAALAATLTLTAGSRQVQPKPQQASPAPKIENFKLDGEKWTCIADGKPLSGVMVKPQGTGPFPAVILSHGLGGNAEGIIRSMGQECVKWGLVCIATSYTHAGKSGGGRGGLAQMDFTQAGARPENVRRALACLEILRQQKDVDGSRISAYGFSMGAFVTIALAAAAPEQIAAAAVASGGVQVATGSTAAAPTADVASRVRAPFLILQGALDRTVPPESSELLKQLLDKSGVPNERHVFEGVTHNVPRERTEEANRLMRQWFTKYGILLPAGARSSSGDYPSPAGVYYVGSAGAVASEKDARYEDIPELDSPFVNGVSFRQFWRNLEPRKGAFDWTPLDNAYRQTKEKHKWLMITVTAGMGSPDWVYDEGAKSIVFDSSESPWMAGKGGEKVRLVVPWDLIYLREWETFLKELGEKIKDWKNVYCVHMTGGGYISEMHLPKRLPETIQQWKNAGASEEICTATWKKIIDAYDRSMPPYIGLSIALSPVLEKYACDEQIYQWAKERYRNRVWFQKNTLKGRMGGPKDSTFLQNAAPITTVSWQMSIAPGRDFGDPKLAFERGVSTLASFIEVYPKVLGNPELSNALMECNAGLKANYEKLKPEYLKLAVETTK